MNQIENKNESDPVDWLSPITEVLAMYMPDGEFADSELPTDAAGRKAICIFHKGEFLTIRIGMHPSDLALDAQHTITTNPINTVKKGI
ncbi:hypothetical protein [Duganella fentianensis]|uniref:hypothetical protein n=1 Tax=Duganella fentianensis TaxID=2692177 RepID=UPI0032B188C9